MARDHFIPSDDGEELAIPTYRVDLSLPPAERYVELATNLAPKMREITPLFDLVLASVIPWNLARRFVKFLAFLFLRKVHSSEETQELVGIARASGVDMYILVALNVLLDSLLGCTSGAVLTRSQKKSGGVQSPPRMLHFRTLDWGMSELRRVLVVLEFVRSDSDDPEKVVARTVTYAGFVGTLTGVRKHLSMSLNFRGNHECSTKSLRMHQLLVLLGIRPSISSIIRRNFVNADNYHLTVEDVARNITETPAAPCYVIISSGRTTTVVQKDLWRGSTKSAADFIVHTNHDFESHSEPSADQTRVNGQQKDRGDILGMETLLEESEERRDCILSKWTALNDRHQRKMTREGRAGEPLAITEQTLRKWVKSYPIMNECTHFGCILDPSTGVIRWIERGDEDLEDSSDTDEESHR